MCWTQPTRSFWHSHLLSSKKKTGQNCILQFVSSCVFSLHCRGNSALSIRLERFMIVSVWTWASSSWLHHYYKQPWDLHGCEGLAHGYCQLFSFSLDTRHASSIVDMSQMVSHLSQKQMEFIYIYLYHIFTFYSVDWWLPLWSPACVLDASFDKSLKKTNSTVCKLQVLRFQK